METLISICLPLLIILSIVNTFYSRRKFNQVIQDLLQTRNTINAVHNHVLKIREEQIYLKSVIDAKYAESLRFSVKNAGDKELYDELVKRGFEAEDKEKRLKEEQEALTGILTAEPTPHNLKQGEGNIPVQPEVKIPFTYVSYVQTKHGYKPDYAFERVSKLNKIEPIPILPDVQDTLETIEAWYIRAVEKERNAGMSMKSFSPSPIPADEPSDRPLHSMSVEMLDVGKVKEGVVLHDKFDADQYDKADDTHRKKAVPKDEDRIDNSPSTLRYRDDGGTDGG